MRRALVLASIFSLAACGGGAGSGSAITPAMHTPATLHLHLAVPASAVTSALRRPLRISPAVMGVGVVVYFHSDATHSTPVGSAAYDVSASSPLCAAGANGSRSCTFDVPAPVPNAGDSDDVIITTYDTAPSGGVIPPSAKALDQGTINVTPVAGGSLSPSVVFGGIPSTVSIAVENPNATYDANLYGGMSYYVEVVAQDASGATIIGSDPYATPIALTSNGNFGAGSTLSVTSPSQTVFITTPASGTSLTMHAASPAASIIANMRAAGFTQTIATLAGAVQIQAGADGNVYVPTATTAWVFDPKTQGLLGTVNAPPGGAFYGVAPLAPGSLGTNDAVLVGFFDGLSSNAGVATVVFGSLPNVIASDPNSPTIIAPFSSGSTAYQVGELGLCNLGGTCQGAAPGSQGVAGSDGLEWIAGGSDIIRVSTDLITVTPFTSGLSSTPSVRAIVSAPDGNLYALDYANGEVVKMHDEWNDYDLCRARCKRQHHRRAGRRAVVPRIFQDRAIRFDHRHGHDHLADLYAAVADACCRRILLERRRKRRCRSRNPLVRTLEDECFKSTAWIAYHANAAVRHGARLLRG